MNAHWVEHYTQVKLRKRVSVTKNVATVLAVGTHCNIGEGLEFVDWILFVFSYRSISEPMPVISIEFWRSVRLKLYYADAHCIHIFCWLIQSENDLNRRSNYLKMIYSNMSESENINGLVLDIPEKQRKEKKIVLALLTVDDDEFWEGVSPVEFGELPAFQNAVTFVGYSIGVDTISVTSGVLSQIKILSYVHGSNELLGLQIDTAINYGSAFNDKEYCVGIAFQSLKHEDVENIGYVISKPVIMHFIQDYKKNGIY
ncbi:hypothetical protein BUALT_Bualt07G0044800 [Buddleja alternifolia]|uniref:Uncharacterized protein n=1 Tax=Buddleja alternifolia TaxID=168488 RepID=A0AAV6XIY4_9LAMI|nr:hypothetical protein BUALT_Bualt07G0044800 [Buddleja alternifolia]